MYSLPVLVCSLSCELLAHDRDVRAVFSWHAVGFLRVVAMSEEPDASERRPPQKEEKKERKKGCEQWFARARLSAGRSSSRSSLARTTGTPS